MNEVAKARVVLLDPPQKAEYDKELMAQAGHDKELMARLKAVGLPKVLAQRPPLPKPDVAEETVQAPPSRMRTHTLAATLTVATLVLFGLFALVLLWPAFSASWHAPSVPSVPPVVKARPSTDTQPVKADPTPRPVSKLPETLEAYASAALREVGNYEANPTAARYDVVRRYQENVIDLYPKTKAADEARKAIDRIHNPRSAAAPALAVPPSPLEQAAQAAFEEVRKLEADLRVPRENIIRMYEENLLFIKAYAKTKAARQASMAVERLRIAAPYKRGAASSLRQANVTGVDPKAKPAPTTEAEAKGPSFFNIGSRLAGKIVYIVDRSGSMTDSMDYVKSELKRSIGALSDKQEFHVVFYSSGPPVEMPTRRLVSATGRNKQLAFEFIDGVIAQGETDPSQALERAFACQPDLIYLLTDGEFDKAIVDLVNRQNVGRKVTVYTIGFLYKTGESVLKQIADQNNGAYQFVSEGDLAKLAN